MKALVYTAPEVLEFQDMPEPDTSGDQALVEIAHVGICGSDMHAFLGHDERRSRPVDPRPRGCRNGDRRADVGKRVTINPLVACGRCEACANGRDNICEAREILSLPPRHGAFAERLAIPSANLVAIPDDVITEKAALAEPIACGWHAVRLARNAWIGRSKRHAAWSSAAAL